MNWTSIVASIGVMEKPQFNLEELATLVDLPRRTVRYYIQQGLVDRPEGLGRGSHYGRRHVEQLLELRKWQAAGLSLERIRELIGPGSASSVLVPPARPRRPGSIEVWSHVVVDEGVEVLVEPQRAELSPEQVRRFTREVMALYARLKKPEE